MPTDIVIPQLGDSVTHGVIANWRKNDGDVVSRDEAVLELETDKVTMEVTAPAAGVLRRSAKVGEQVAVGASVGKIEEGGAVSAGKPAAAAAPAANGASKPAAPAAAPVPAPASGDDDVRATPLARKLAGELGVDLNKLHGTGAGGRVREEDVRAFAESRKTGSPAAPAAAAKPAAVSVPAPATGGVRRERMSQLRQRIAARLVEAQHTAAMLTTFNECDMSSVMALRAKHKDAFEKKHGVGLGFMSFFVKAVVGALRSFPAVNASIVTAPTGEMEVEYHDSQDIAIAVGTPKGLVVPVLRGCQTLSFAQVEAGIKELAVKAKDGKLALTDLQGGTFTITNGGIYGSLMSTPILNPPQTGILGMHAIKNRPIEDPKNPGQIVLRPMMYLALSYDHRLIDGAEAVQFLVAVKNGIEEPERLLIGM
jgi:2-oxoglutarate dehydrogenase E2 component (dihydrolipoamide succinyltransferase)